MELFSYDEEGRVTDKWIWTGERRDWDTHLAYEYNRLGEVTRMKVDVDGQVLYQHYEYNQLGQLHKVFVSTSGNYDSQNDDPEVTYTYTPAGGIDKIVYRGGREVDYEYTIRDWVATINSVSSPGGSFAAFYSYQKNGNIAMSRFYNPMIDLSSSHRDYRYLYSYDNLNRLTGADYRYGASGTAINWFNVDNLSYDANGNIQTLRRRDDTGTLVDNLTYNYGSNNRLSGVNDAAGKHHSWDAFSSSFGYDDNGNMTSQSGKFTNIVYEHRNLPVHFYLDNDDELIANYNAEGQRILKESSGGGWSFYVTEGMQTLAVITEQGLSHMNLVGGGTFGRIVANSSGNITTSNTRYYHITDHLGSTRAVVNNSGGLVETFDYYPFGLLMPKRNTASALTREKFTGHERDNEVGLDYMVWRRYDPALGRFLGVDPLADQYPGISPYVYALNNPLIFIDPDGREVIALTEEEQNMIISTLHEDVRKFVQFDSEGRLNTELLSQADSESGNLAALLTLAQHETVFLVQLSGEFAYTDADGNIQTMAMPEVSVDPTFEGGIYTPSTMEIGYTGQTLLPSTSDVVNSPNSNAYIIVNPSLSPLGRAETFAHEAYGHGYMFARGMDSAHRVVGMRETNIPLRNQIQARMHETRKNFPRNR